MKSRVVSTQIVGLGKLDGFYHRLGNQFGIVIDASQMLHDIQQQGSTTSQEQTGVSGNDSSVFQFNGCRRVSCPSEALFGSYRRTTIVGIDFSLFEEQLYLVNLCLITSP